MRRSLLGSILQSQPASSSSSKPITSSLPPTPLLSKKPQVRFISQLATSIESNSLVKSLPNQSSSSSHSLNSFYQSEVNRLRAEINALLNGSSIFQQSIGGCETLDPSAILGRVFLSGIKSAIKAAQAVDQQNWERTLSEALRQASEQRIQGAGQKGKGVHRTIRKQISLDDFRLAKMILQSKSSTSSSAAPTHQAYEATKAQRTREDVEALLGGDAFLFQPMGKFPPYQFKMPRACNAVRRLSFTALSLEPSSARRDGLYPPSICLEVERAALERHSTLVGGHGGQNVALADLEAAEEVLHSKRLEMIAEEITKYSFDEVPDSLVENISGLQETKAMKSRSKPELYSGWENLKKRISEHWKNEDWISEFLFPHFPPISLRSNQLLTGLKSAAQFTAAENEGQFQGYPVIFKKAIRRAILERIIVHDSKTARSKNTRGKKRSSNHVIPADLDRALSLIEVWKRSNPEEKLR